MDGLIIECLLDKGAYAPTKAHKADAGMDLYSPVDFTIDARGSASINTGVHFNIPEGYVGMIKSKSGLNKKDGILCEGVIDAGYTGPIGLKMYNNHDKDKTFKRGDKLTQIVIMPIPDVELFFTFEFDETDRGDKGFGSSGR